MIHRVSDNLQRIRGSIESVILQHSLTQPVTLVAVSKLQPSEAIQAAYDAGQRDFGENYVDELLTKARSLPRDINWHMIGHVQSNKLSKLLSVENLSVIHTVDSLSLALKINKKLQEIQKNLDFFLQINTSDENSKSGIRVFNFFEVLEEILKNCSNLKFKGFMTIGEKGSVEDFEILRKCRKETAEKIGVDEEMVWLSMGMSGDFEQALQYGSNFVRIGSSIFGERPGK
jgi:pyridoxal phosphate enzyme (YggS family)